ncbi:hypothetical protein ABPG72_012168 [Tetrahymena utriculariae]
MSGSSEQSTFLDKINEKLIEWQLTFEEPIFRFINSRRIKHGGIQNLPIQEQEYFTFETDTFKMEMFSAAFVIPINFFTIMYSREENKQVLKNMNKVRFYHYGALATLIPCVCVFGYSIYRRFIMDTPHEKALTSKYYSELQNFQNN